MNGFAEQLESRTLLAGTVSPGTDPGGSTSSAHDLGAITGITLVNQSIGKSDASDVYRFRVASKGNVNLNLSRLQANANLVLLNSKGKPIVDSTRDGTRSENISRSLRKGSYFVRVTGTKSATPYRLKLQADLNWGSVSLDGERRNVGLVFASGAPRPINSNRPTWIVIHGWRSTPRGHAISNLSDAIDEKVKRDQVLVLDWSAAASEGSVIGAAEWVPPIADWVARKLSSWGLTTPEINVAGHSLGGFMTGAIAEEVSGGIDRAIALDPATISAFGVDFSNIDYADNSRFSLAFIGSDFSSPPAAYTADETIRMDIGAKNSIFTHSNVVELFAEMVRESKTSSPDAISRLFSLDRLNHDDRPNYDDNAFGKYEAILTGRFQNDRWRPLTFKYEDADTGKTVTVKA